MTIMNSLQVFIPRGLRRKSSRRFEAPRERSPVLPQEDKGSFWNDFIYAWRHATYLLIPSSCFDMA